ncbi:MAG: Lrp/AsnC family transcriptional regulator [Pseudomonadota bacterium]
MDAIDRRIIRALQQNGRISNQDLADMVGLSPSPCLRRVRKLEERGVLTGYAAQVDQVKYGLPVDVFVSISLSNQTDIALQAFERAVQRLDEVMECYLMTGSRDYLLRVVCDGLNSYERFTREHLATLPGIRSIESSFALGCVKQRGALPEVHGQD